MLAFTFLNRILAFFLVNKNNYLLETVKAHYHSLNHFRSIKIPGPLN
jgi:hypothetical protein